MWVLKDVDVAISLNVVDKTIVFNHDGNDIIISNAGNTSTIFLGHDKDIAVERWIAFLIDLRDRNLLLDPCEFLKVNIELEK